MRKTSFIEWFCPLFVLAAYALIIWIDYKYLDVFAVVETSWILIILFLALMIAVLPTIAIFGASTATGLMTDGMGDSFEERDAGYYEGKFEGNTLKINRATDVKTTWVWWLQTFLFFTYLFWCIPGYIHYKNKYNRWKEKGGKDEY